MQIPGTEGLERATRNEDFLGIFPPNVMPTGDLAVLEQGDSLLFIKSMAYAAELSPKQTRIFRLLTNGSPDVGYSNPDSPGTITVVAVWGLGEAQREWVIFKYGSQSTRHVGERADFQLFLSGWFAGSKRRR